MTTQKQELPATDLQEIKGRLYEAFNLSWLHMKGANLLVTQDSHSGALRGVEGSTLVAKHIQSLAATAQAIAEVEETLAEVSPAKTAPARKKTPARKR